MADSELVTSKQRNKQIDKYLKEEKKKYKEYVKKTMRLLLVGELFRVMGRGWLHPFFYVDVFCVF